MIMFSQTITGPHMKLDVVMPLLLCQKELLPSLLFLLVCYEKEYIIDFFKFKENYDPNLK